MHWFKPVGDNDFSMMTSHVANICGFYWHFFKPYDNQIYQDGEPGYINLTCDGAVTTTSSRNKHGFISFSSLPYSNQIWKDCRPAHLALTNMWWYSYQHWIM